LKRARADFIIENDGTFAQLERRVNDVWTALSRDAAGPRSAAAVP
jgi:dephospho-CoA kinase